MSKLAIEIWEKHIETFNYFDLVNNNLNSLEEETKMISLFSAITTLEYVAEICGDTDIYFDIFSAIEYLKSSKYYSTENLKSDH